MSFKELKLKRSYETDLDRSFLLNDFYIPLLERSHNYYRIAGFFSSSSLSIAAEGIEGLISNGGKMFLLISPELSKDDLDVIVQHGNINENSSVFREFKIDEFNPDEHLQALAYLLDSGKLQIKIVVPTNNKINGIFHEKIGVFDDGEGNLVSFSGSINESAHGWLGNIEEFKVFCSWIPGQKEYIRDDLKKFFDYWKNERKELAKTYDLPESIKQSILKVVPRDVRDLRIMERYQKNKKLGNTLLKPFSHQERAIKMWVENNCKLMMEMATGTGKTRTAIGCALTKITTEKPLLIIVSTPQNTLSRQWLSDMDELKIHLDRAIVADGTNGKWKNELELVLFDLEQKKIDNTIVYTTHATSSSDRFIEIIKRTKRKTKVLFICDEAHAIATAKQKRALLDEYDYRIGLTATPERMFDEGGTRMLREYFGNKSFEFTIFDALHTINEATGKPFLNQFKYHPIFVGLTDEEYKKYQKYSQRIAAIINSDETDEDKLEQALEQRANILKNAENKINVLEGLLCNIGTDKVSDSLLFVSPQQLEKSMEMLSRIRISRAKITEEESTSKKKSEDESERQRYITDFKNKYLQMLVAIKCLDEGIDIPSARVAFLLSNGKNPREYIQRIGRVIRQAPGKSISEIYDFVVYSHLDEKKRIIRREFERAYQIAQNAINRSEVIDIFEKMGVTIDANK